MTEPLAGPIPDPDFDGQVVLSRHEGDRPGLYRIRIDRADPRTRISAQLLRQAMEGECRLITVDGDELDRIVIADDYGQRFIYRLGKYEALYDAFEMEWPD